jgi:tetratricopeptide (TPR) repeat protein
MDANNEARAKGSKTWGGCAVFSAALGEFFALFAVKRFLETAKFAKEDAKLPKGVFGYLILVGLLLPSVGPQASAQQSTKTIPSSINRPRTTGTPSKISTTPQPTSSGGSGSVNDPQQLLAAGQTAQQQGRFEEALRTYNRLIALSAKQPRTTAIAHFRIGNIYMAQGKFGNAEVAFERAVALNPTDAESYNNLGEALGELKQYQRALEAFSRAISLDPKLLKAKYNQAVSYDRMGNFRYSEFVFRNLIKTNPGYSLSYDGLAVTLSKAGRGKEAIAFHEKAIALDPKEPSYYFNCAISYLMMGNTAKALEQQEKLKALDAAIANRLASVIVKHQM